VQTLFAAGPPARLATKPVRLAVLGSSTTTHLHASIRVADAVLVPSIWWENSPVVIQEAFRNNRPGLCSDIGGMAEKVPDGVDGYPFPVGNGLELSYLLVRMYEDRRLLRGLPQTMRVPPTAQQVLAEHLSLYASIVSPAQTVAAL
jgi:glycosyltransferase involved in cell wall biosynthesis